MLAGTLGVAVGLGAAIAFYSSQRAMRNAANPIEPALGEGVVSVLSALPSAVVVIDSDDVVVRSNASAYALGVVRNDRIANADILRMARKVRRDGIIRTAELEMARGLRDGQTVPVHVRAATLGTSLILLLVDDRSEARRVDAVRRDFVANISHELKTPVGALSLLAETIEAAADDPVAVQHFAGQMKREAGRLGSLVSEIIELSRVQSAGAISDFERLNVDEIVSEAIDEARVRAAARDIKLEVKGQDGLEVLGEHGLLVAAVRNLVDNAVSYSEPKTHVTVAVTSSDDVVSISVVDQGIGISAENLERVWERFFRVDPARSRDTGGTGLGLSIVKHVVTEHGGTVSAWSLPGQGSTFTLRLPRAQAAPTPEESLVTTEET